MSALVTKEILNYTLINDLNVCIHTLNMHITTDFAEEDEKRFFLQPADMLEILTLIYYNLQNRFTQEIHPQPLEGNHPDLVAK